MKVWKYSWVEYDNPIKGSRFSMYKRHGKRQGVISAESRFQAKQKLFDRFKIYPNNLDERKSKPFMEKKYRRINNFSMESVNLTQSSIHEMDVWIDISDEGY